MMQCDFYSKLMKLNSQLRVFWGAEGRAAGLYILRRDGMEMEHICGLDKGNIPEFTTYDHVGHIIKGGWRRTLSMLLGLKLISLVQSQKLFGYWNERHSPHWYKEQSAIDKELERIEARGYWKQDEIVDVGREITKLKHR